MSRHTLQCLLVLILLCGFGLQAQNKVITIQIIPNKVTLTPGKKYRFVARGFDRYNKEVPFSPEWSATGGRIKQSGWFKAGRRAGVYSIMATDTRTGAQGSAAVIIKYTTPEEQEMQVTRRINRLRIRPNKVILNPGESVRFVVTAYNALNKRIRMPFQPLWKVTGGSITVDGIYQAGGAPGKYLVRVKEPMGVVTSAEVIIRGTRTKIAAIKIFPAGAKLRPYEQKRFFATAYNTAGVVVQVKPRWEATGGTINSNGIYRAKEAPGTYFVKAIAPGGVSTTSTIVVQRVRIAKVEVFPKSAVLYPGQIQKFKVESYGRKGKKVPSFPLWSATGGIIQLDGTYQAGNTPGNYVLTVTVGKVTVERSIVIKAGYKPSKLVISPRKLELTPGQMVTFVAKAYNRLGKRVAANIKWQAHGGRIDDSGLYHAGAKPGKYMVIASLEDNLTAKAIVSIALPTQNPVAWLTLKPSLVQLKPGEKVQFSVKGVDKSGKTVPCAMSWSAAGGKISATGLYKAGPKNGKFAVHVSSGRIKANATVIINNHRSNLGVSTMQIMPKRVYLQKGQRCTFQVTMTDAKGQITSGQIQWQASGGKINLNGNYHAGNKTGKYSVIATEISSGLSEQAEVHIVAKSSPQPQGKKPLRILRWRMGHGSRLIGKAFIRGRIYSARGYLLKLVVIRKNGSQKILAQIRVSRGQKFEFRGSYVRSSTHAVAIILLDDNLQQIYKVQKP